MNASTASRQPQEARSRRPVNAGVLIGGASTRMGQSKSLLRYDGTAFAARVIAAVRGSAERVVFLGDGPTPADTPQVERLADAPDLAGPLAGILAALRWAPDACWIIVACDLPLLRPAALDWLLGQRGPGRAAVLPSVSPARVEPLLAIYEPESLVLIERLVSRGLRSPHRLGDEPTVYTPTPPASLRECWTNVNTPEEFRQLGRGTACAREKRGATASRSRREQH